MREPVALYLYIHIHASLQKRILRIPRSLLLCVCAGVCVCDFEPKSKSTPVAEMESSNLALSGPDRICQSSMKDAKQAILHTCKKNWCRC